MTGSRRSDALFGSKMGWERAELFRAVEGGSADRIFLGASELVSPGPPPSIAAARERGGGLRPDARLRNSCCRAATRDARCNSSSPTTSPCRSARTVYTGMLNERGKYRKRSHGRAARRRPLPDRHRQRAGDARRRLDQARNRCGRRTRHLTDVTSAYAVIAVMGPRSRELLATITGRPLDNAAFPFGAVREIGIGPATVLAARRNLCRRARMGALCAGRVGGGRV